MDPADRLIRGDKWPWPGFEAAFPDFWDESLRCDGVVRVPYKFVFPIGSSLDWLSPESPHQKPECRKPWCENVHTIGNDVLSPLFEPPMGGNAPPCNSRVKPGMAHASTSWRVLYGRSR